MWARARGWVPSPSDSPPRRVAPRQGWPRLGRARTRVPLSLSHSFQKRNTHPKERNVSEQRMCVFTSSCSNPILRENPQSSSLARQNFGKTLQNISLSGGRFSGGGHIAPASVAAAAKRQRESLRSLTGRRRGGPRSPDRISAATRASYLASARAFPPSRVFVREENRKATSGGLSSFSSEA